LIGFTTRTMAIQAAESHLLKALGNPRFIAAPMVGQSDLAFRLLARRHGCDLAFTQMLHGKNFATVPKFREENFDPLSTFGGGSSEQQRQRQRHDHHEHFPPSLDRPLIAQFCGDSPDVVVAAAKHVEGCVDAVDLNLGCPQKIARKGHYGAYLLREPDTVKRLVEGMVQGLAVPVTVKMRVLEDSHGGVEGTVAFAKMLEACGASAVTLHGRTVKQNKNLCGACDWSAIGEVAAALSIPVVGNGGIETTRDAVSLLRTTSVAAVMSSEALLENPGLFAPDAVATAEELFDDDHHGRGGESQSSDESDEGEDDGGDFEAKDATAQAAVARQLAFAREYVALAERFPPRDEMATVKGHCFKFLHVALERNHDVREGLVKVASGADVVALVDELCRRYALPTTRDTFGGGGGGGGGASSAAAGAASGGGGGILNLHLHPHSTEGLAAIEAEAAAHVRALREAPTDAHWQAERRRRRAAGEPIAGVAERSWYRRHRR
jgi:tRNA-dihydrouridine synthase 1